jgi:hypothetical protein
MARYQRAKQERKLKKRKILVIADGKTEINYIKDLFVLIQVYQKYMT